MNKEWCTAVLKCHELAPGDLGRALVAGTARQCTYASTWSGAFKSAELPAENRAKTWGMKELL